MPTKMTRAIVLVIWIIILILSFYRDTIMVNQDGFGDLRNRVVGARLMMDSKSPYWYKWEAKDGTRYYDRWNIFPLKVTNITATPFFHHLIEPIANIDQKKLSQYWLVIEYAAYLLTVIIAMTLPGIKTKWNYFLLIPAFLFVVAVPWIAHNSVGQNYIFIPLLLILFFFIFQKQNKNIGTGLVCGTLAISAILIRPTLILFFIPVLFHFFKLNKTFIAGAILPLIAVFVWFFSDKQEQLYWRDYKDAISEQIKYHQNLNPTPAQIEQPPAYTEIEGVNIKKSVEFRDQMKKQGIFLQFQTASIYKNIGNTFHKTIPVIWLEMLGAGFCVLLMVCYWLQQRQQAQPDIVRDVIAGFCLYFISDIFSPVYRGEYAAVTWLFPIALLPSVYKMSMKYPCILFFAGFVLNIFYFKIYKIQYAIGEYAMFVALLFLIFPGILQFKPRQNQAI